MCTTGRPGRRPRPRRQRGLAGPGGPSTQISRPAPSVGGRASARASRHRASDRAQKALPTARGRSGPTSTNASPASRCTVVGVLEELAGLARAGTTPGRRSAAARPRARSAASAPRRRPRARSGAGRPAPTGVGSRSGPAGPEATRPPPCTVAIAGDGFGVTGRPKNAAGRGVEGLVVVEQRRHEQARAGGDLGDHRVGGGGLDRAGAAGVPELQLGDLAQRVGDLAGGAPPAGSATAT